MDEFRDAKGHYAELRCVNGHDRCYLGPTDDCPYCERSCQRCRDEIATALAKDKLAAIRAGDAQTQSNPQSEQGHDG